MKISGLVLNACFCWLREFVSLCFKLARAIFKHRGYDFSRVTTFNTNVMNTISIPRPRPKTYLPKDFKVDAWSDLKPYYEELLSRDIQSAYELDQWITDRSELDAVVNEEFSWRYINVTKDSSDDYAAQLYNNAVEDLAPKVTSFENELDNKMVASPYLNQLDDNQYAIYLRGVKNGVQLFREQNVKLAKDIQLKSKEYVKIFSEMTIGVEGKQMTLHKASALLEETDRVYRESVYHKINTCILEHTNDLEDLFDNLLRKRHEMALNAGFDNFRDFKFQALGRFDYTVEDCEQFHESIKTEIIPLTDQLNAYRKEALGLDDLRPWDLFVDPSGLSPLRPFEQTSDLLKKTIQCLHKVDPLYGRVIQVMRKMGHLDLETRKGKRHGGYNMPLHVSGVPFIFMNATNSLSDLRTLMHESGHAVHSYLTREYKLKSAKRVPSEVAELAAMTMELLSMEHWNVFFPNQEELKRAHFYQLEYILKVLPWIATIDKFQHWIYMNPEHSREERKENWKRIFKEFNSIYVNHTGLEHYLDHLWHKQLHIFEVPFYYIEYGMAQLGAIAIWKKYRENPDLTLRQFTNALKLGYTRPIGEIYQTAGIAFDFSRSCVSQLGKFVKKELDSLLH